MIDQIDFECVALRQQCDEHTRARYSRFDRSPTEMAMRVHNRELYPERFATMDDVIEFMDELVDLKRVLAEESGCSDPRVNERALEHLSFGLCLLGMPASYGDLLCHLNNAPILPIYQAHRIRYDDPLTAFKNGDMKTVVRFIDLGFRYAMYKLRKSGLPMDPVPPVLIRLEQGDACEINFKVLATTYYFHRSMLEFLSGTTSIS